MAHWHLFGRGASMGILNSPMARPLSIFRSCSAKLWILPTMKNASAGGIVNFGASNWSSGCAHTEGMHIDVFHLQMHTTNVYVNRPLNAKLGDRQRSFELLDSSG